MVVEFSVVPIGQGEELAQPVADVLAVVHKSGLPYTLTAMGTIVEGEWDAVFALIKACHRRMRRHANRVVTHVAVDDRGGARRRMAGKVRDVESILGHPLSRAK